MPHTHAAHRGAGLVGLAALLLAACTAPPAGERGPLVTAQRVLAIDFGGSAHEHRSLAWQRLRATVPAEAARAASLPAPSDLLAAEGQRTTRARSTAASTLALATRRPQRVPQALRTDPAHWATDLVDALAALPALLRLEQRAMGEATDRRHRTDPTDERPEASLASRLVRRLGL